MRLIDADRMLLIINMKGTNKFGIFDEDIRKFLEVQRTVEAIPMSWIIGWLTKQTIPATSYGLDCSAIHKMLDDWEDEDANDNT